MVGISTSIVTVNHSYRGYLDNLSSLDILDISDIFLFILCNMYQAYPTLLNKPQKIIKIAIQLL